VCPPIPLVSLSIPPRALRCPWPRPFSLFGVSWLLGPTAVLICCSIATPYNLVWPACPPLLVLWYHTRRPLDLQFNLAHVNGVYSRYTPGVFYTYFYNHAHRLRLEKLLSIELSRSSNGFFKPLLDPGGGFTSETAARRFQKLNGRYRAVSEVKRTNI
jgi:hypothetical protein